MQIPNEILSAGFTLPKLGFGTWRMGRGRDYGATENDDLEIKAIRSAYENGMIHIDTAELYGSGYVEELVAKAMQGVERNTYFLTSKVMGQHATYDGIHQAIRDSLTRLQTDYLDLYLIHYRDSSLPLEPAMKAMNELVEQGLIKNIGVSNFAPDTLAEAQSYSQRKIVCDQVQYSLVHREAEANGLVDYCQENDVILVAWAPVLKIDHATAKIPLVRSLMDKYDKTARQIAINWLTSQEKICTLVKTSDPTHLEENLESASFVMNIEDVELLRQEFPGQVFANPGFPMR